MAEVKEVTVPDIGDFDDVPVIEVLVAPGDTVAAEDPLVTLESDKATMDVPSPFAGVVQDLKVSVGDKVAEGTLLMSLEIGESSGNGGAPKDEPGRSESPPEAAAPRSVETATEAEAESAAEQAPQPTESPSASDGSEPPYASPAVRRPCSRSVLRSRS